MLDAAHCDARGEHRQKAVCVHELRGAEREFDQAQREEALETERLRMARTQPGNRMRRDPAEQAADRNCAGYAPSEAAREPERQYVADSSGGRRAYRKS